MTTLGIVTILLSLTVTGLGLTSQARKNSKRKSVEGLSFFYFLILAISYSFWVLYGIFLKDWVLIIPMFVGATMSWVVTSQFYFYKNK